jgi:methylated-DNA-protein-cysteine methyltransferase-like protein
VRPCRTSDRDQAVQRIRATVDAIPRGRVATYGRVAELAGLPRRARLVGRILAELEDGSALPWHRVVGAGGLLSPRPGGVAEQRRRLGREGVRFGPTGRIDLARFGWGAEG